MDVSVLIPSHGRADKLAALLRSLEAQRPGGPSFEVGVGLDGGTEAEAREAMGVVSEHRRRDFSVRPLPRCGQASVRNTLLERAAGRIILWLNDDVIASPTLIAEHRRAHEQAAADARRVMVVGAADWRVHADDTLFDRLVRETSMIFFYNVMDDPARGDTSRVDWGFRHAWTINLSMLAEDVREVGGFRVFGSWYGSEDIDLGFRLAALRGGRAVWYRRAAAVTHDHRVSLREYVEREYKLGYNALHFAKDSPEASLATYRRDLGAPAEAAYSREFVSREREGARRARAHLESLCGVAVNHELGWPALRDSLYLAHLPLKRWCWRLGLADCADGAALDASRALAQSA